MNNNMYYNQNAYYNPPRKKRHPILKFFAIIGIIAVVAVAGAFIIITIVSANSNKLVCKSDQGNITIMYNDKEIVGYTATGMSYDLDEQKAYAKRIGVDAYINEFSTWFSTNTTGTCEKQEK